MSAADHYDVLGVARDVGPVELRRAYLDLARRHHPDRPGGDPDRMRAINDAWAVLSDPGRRAGYDLTLREPSPPTSSPRRAPDDRWAADPRYDPTDDLTEEELRAWRRGFESLDLRDLRDDRPIGGTVVLPRWAAMVPPGMFVGSVVVFCLGVVVNAGPIVALAFSLLLLSVVAFLAAPFVALLLSRRGRRRDLEA